MQNNAHTVCLETTYPKKMIMNCLKYAQNVFKLLENLTNHAGFVISTLKSTIVPNVVMKLIQLRLFVRSV
jgi:hypothetical protein